MDDPGNPISAIVIRKSEERMVAIPEGRICVGFIIDIRVNGSIKRRNAAVENEDPVGVKF